MNARDTMFALVAACALVACSGDDDTTEPTTVASSAPATVATTAPPTTTDAPPTTTAPPSTPPPTTATPTTAPPTPATTGIPPTTGPLDEAEAIAAIIDAAEGAWRSYHDALLDPENDAKVARISNYYDGPILDGLLTFVEEYRANGYRLVENDALESSFSVSPLFVTLDLDDGLATAVGCHVNGYVKVQTGGNPDGSDLVLDDSVIRRAETRQLEFIDGTWKVTEAGLPPDDSEVVPSCA